MLSLSRLFEAGVACCALDYSWFDFGVLGLWTTFIRTLGLNVPLGAVQELAIHVGLRFWFSLLLVAGVVIRFMDSSMYNLHPACNQGIH